MSLTILATIVLTGAIIIFIIVVSSVLVVHKNSTRHRLAVRRRRKDFYAQFVTEFLMADIPPRDPEIPASEHFELYERLLRPMKASLGRMSRKRRNDHREALLEVVIDFAKDLSGEAAERIVFLSYSFNFVDGLVQLLKSHRWWVRTQAARDLGHLGVKRAVTPLTHALEDKDAEVRFEAMQALIKLVGVEAFRTIFRVGRNLTTWNMMALSIIVLRYQEDAIPFLLEGLDAKDQTVVIFCIEMLAEIGFVAAVDPLRTVAEKYPNVQVRTKAMEALGRLGDARAVPLLLKSMSDSYPRVRVAALNALRRVGTPSAVPRLSRRLKEGEIEEKLAAARALASSGKKGISELRKASKGHESLSARVAMQVMEEVGDMGEEMSRD